MQRIAGPVVELGFSGEKVESGISNAGLKIAQFGLSAAATLTTVALKANVTADSFKKLGGMNLMKISNGLNTASIAMRGLLLAAGAGALLAKAIGATREQLAELLAIADKARDRNIGADFFQGIVSESLKLRVAASDMEEALSHAFQATKEKSPIDLAKWETGEERITEVEKALRVFNATGEKIQSLVLFRDAESQEQKIEAVLQAMKELETQGRKLESLQLGELMFGSKFSDNIRLGKTSVDSILQSMQAAKEAGDGVFSERMIERAKQVDDQLKLAHQRLDKEMKPSWETLASIMLDIKESWTWVVDKAAAFVGWINRADLRILKSELAEVDKALSEGPSSRSGLYSLWSDRMLQERRDSLQGMIDDRSGPSTRPMITVNKPSRGEGAAPTKKEDSTSRDRFDSAADSIEKRTAALNAETAAIDLGTAARERAKVIAELETVALQQYGTVTGETREKIIAIADAWGAAREKLEAVNGPMATWIRQSQDINKSLQNLGTSSLDRVADTLSDIADGSKSAAQGFEEFSKFVIKELQKMIIKFALAALLKAFIGGDGGIGSSLAPNQFAAAFPTPFKNGGLALAGGGAISGPGGPRSDSILAALSDGEFVVNAEATKKHRSLLEAINSGFSLKPMMSAFANGGAVGMSAPFVPETCFVGSIGGSDVRVYH